MTTYRDNKEKREQEISDHYAALVFTGFDKSSATIATMKKFNIFSRVTIWAIRKRVTERNKK